MFICCYLKATEKNNDERVELPKKFFSQSLNLKMETAFMWINPTLIKSELEFKEIYNITFNEPSEDEACGEKR